jgi:hypothetical protein
MANAPIIFKGTSAKMLNSGALEFKDGTKVETYAGNPDGNISAPKGSLVIDTTNNLLYKNSSGADSWVRADRQALYKNAGIVSAGAVTNNGDGTVTVGDTTVNFYDNSSWTGDIYQEVVTGGTFTIVDDINSLSYVVVDYNAGSPTMRLTTTASDIDGATVFPVITASRNGTNVCVLDWNSTGAGTTEKLFQKDTITKRFYVDTPLVLDETGTNNVTVSSGSVWFGTKKTTLDAVDSSADGTVTTFYHSGGSWTCVEGTTYNNTQYDNGTDLATLTTNRFAVNWIFRTVDNSKKNVCVVLGQGDYTLAEALESKIPTIPEAIRGICVFIGRIIVQKSDSTAERIEQIQETSLNTAGVSDHNSLTGLNDGDYKHLTATEYTALSSVDTANIAYKDEANIFSESQRFNAGAIVNNNLDIYGNYSIKTWSNDGTTQYSYIRGNSTSLNFSAVDVPMTFKVGSVGGTEAMRITGDGKVGIGTDSPSAPLHILSNAVGATALYLEGRSSDDLSNIYFRDNGNTVSKAAIEGGDGTLRFYYNDGSLKEGFRVDAAGNIAMGKLTVFNSAGDVKIVNNSTSSSPYIRRYFSPGANTATNSAGLSVGMVNGNNNGALFSFTSDGSTDASGNYNVVTSLKTLNLGVSSMRETCIWNPNGNMWVEGDVSAASFTDRTPYPDSLQTAIDAVNSMQRLPDDEYDPDNKEKQLDHSKMHPYLNGSGEELSRDMSAAISCQNEVIKYLLKEKNMTKFYVVFALLLLNYLLLFAIIYTVFFI